MSTFKIIMIAIGSLLAMLILSFALNYLNLVSFGFFAPKYENVRRETFKNTQSYVDGKTQDLASYKLQYETCHTKDSVSNREAIRNVIRSQFANFDESKLSGGLQLFLIQTRGY